MSFVYLACPYTHPSASVREARFGAVCRAAAKLMKEGQAVFAPIAHSHPIEMLAFETQESGNFWKGQDVPILRHAAKLVVLKLAGWEESAGIKWEIETAQALFIPVEFMEAE